MKTPANISLHDLGFNKNFQQEHKRQFANFGIGRVVLEHKERYVVKTPEGDLEAEVIGNLRFTAQSRMDFPAVGDWVAISPYDDGKALIHGFLPRKSLIARKAIGKQTDQQIVACNIDTAFVVQAVNRDFSLNRIERYLAICKAGQVQPVIVISKIDLVASDQLEDLLQSVRNRIPNVPVLAISNQDLQGIGELKTHVTTGKTFCVLGSSGVGKSTLINSLVGEAMLKTGEISAQSDRGKHVTSYRELIVLPTGGVIIDTPGMREIGMAESDGGISDTFDTISQYATQCLFDDCTHIHEKGCAVVAAVQANEIDIEQYENYVKLVREQQHYQTSETERRRQGKHLAKLIKNMKKDRKRYNW